MPIQARLAAPILVVGLSLMAVRELQAAPPETEADGVRVFREKIEPILVARCYQCHSSQAEKTKGGLRVDTRAGLLHGGNSGPAVVPGKSAESLLIQAIRHEDGMAMPPKMPKLPDATIADFVGLG